MFLKISRKDYVNVLIEALSEKNEINDGKTNGEKLEFANLKIEKRLSTNVRKNKSFLGFFS
jgi:IS1 family transposase